MRSRALVASAAIGEHTRSECREAKTAWRLGNALRREAE